MLVSARQVRIRPIDGPGHLVLRETGDLVELLAGSVVLLSSAALGTEFAFGRLAASLAGGAPRRIVVGGLGFGATVRGVLDVAAPDASILVVEKVEAVIELVRGPMAHVAADVLDDARVTVVPGDIRAVVAAAPGDADSDPPRRRQRPALGELPRKRAPVLAGRPRGLEAGAAQGRRARRLERLPLRLVPRRPARRGLQAVGRAPPGARARQGARVRRGQLGLGELGE